MQRLQIILPKTLNGSNAIRAPYMCDKQAFGYKENMYIEYVITLSTGGSSSQSGETLYGILAKKIEQHRPKDNYSFFGYPREHEIRLYINDKGEAYRTWNGKLAGRPVCNFYTGDVYYYGR